MLFLTEGLLAHEDVHVDGAIDALGLQSCKLHQVQLFAFMIQRDAAKENRNAIGQLHDAVWQSIFAPVEMLGQDLEQMGPQLMRSK